VVAASGSPIPLFFSGCCWTGSGVDEAAGRACPVAGADASRSETEVPSDGDLDLLEFVTMKEEGGLSIDEAHIDAA
jgi:hypothetical protein